MKKPQDSITFDSDIRERIAEEVKATPKGTFSSIVNTLVTEAFRERDRRKGWKKKNNQGQSQ